MTLGLVIAQRHDGEPEQLFERERYLVQEEFTSAELLILLITLLRRQGEVRARVKTLDVKEGILTLYCSHLFTAQSRPKLGMAAPWAYRYTFFADPESPQDMADLEHLFAVANWALGHDAWRRHNKALDELEKSKAATAALEAKLAEGKAESATFRAELEALTPSFFRRVLYWLTRGFRA